MAAERTFLAWIRTSIALMAFGFVIARFGMFVRGFAGSGGTASAHGSGASLAGGVTLIGAGILLCIVSAFRYRQYVREIDEGRFRGASGLTVAFGVAGLLVVAGIGMALFLVTL